MQNGIHFDMQSYVDVMTMKDKKDSLTERTESTVLRNVNDDAAS